MRVGALLPLVAVLVASATAKTRHGGAAGIPTAADNGCPTQFQQRCTCGLGQYPLSAHTEHKYIVNCTDAGFTDALMLQHLPEETEILLFTGNRLGELPTNIFGTTGNYDFLSVVDLSNNYITFIPGRTFHKVSSVQTLYLNHNDIEISERERPRMFSNFDSLVNLHLTNAFTENTNSSYYLLSLEDIFYMSDLSLVVKLHLEQNEIYTIGKNASIFCELKALQQLYLGDNKLSDLDFRLDCMPDLTYVDLQRNMIKRLSEDAMHRIDQKVKYSPEPVTVEFKQNPFACDCLSKGFINWLQSTSVTVRDLKIYRCNDGIPKTNIGKMLTEVDTDHLHCSNEHFRHVAPPPAEGYSSSAVGVLSFLLAFVSSILLAVAVYHRQWVRGQVVSRWEYLTRKVGYSGLAAEEITKATAV